MRNKGKFLTFLLLLFSFTLFIGAGLPASVRADTAVFINEIHYDNAGTDEGEAIEIAGPAGTDLTGWSLVRYNGNGGASYGTDSLDGFTIPNLENGFGVIVISYPANGLQNGAPDGVALLDASNVVVQFLSYEGTFDATDGPANGMSSTDIGVSESGSGPIGDSLQLTGTGSIYEDFSWAASMASTFGAVNTGQTFSGSSVETAPTVSATTPGNGAINVAVANDIDITFSEDVVAAGNWFDISCTAGGAFTAVVTGGPQTYTLNPDSDFANDDSCTVTVFAAQVTDTDTDDPPDNMESDFVFSFNTTSGGALAALVINEIDYDQPGTDAAEFIELKNTGTDSINLDEFAVQLINGNGNAVYDTIDLPNVDLAAGDYFVICGNNANTPNCDLAVAPATNLIQNGSPDAAAIVQGSTIIDAVSYEGDVTGYVEGSGVGLVDDTNADFGGISRFPDGVDTDQNNIDLSFRCITPGSENSEENSACASPVVETCGAPFTAIAAIQGSGSASPLQGTVVSTEGVVTADFSASNQLNGFYLQDPLGDGDPATSEGIFVFAPGSSVVVGDHYRVRGTVSEFFGLTQVGSLTHLVSCGVGAVIDPTIVTLPVTAVSDWEMVEGMLVKIDQELSVSDNFNLGRYGELLLSVNGRLQNPTNVVEPGSAASDLQDLNNRSSIQLDDGSNVQNPLPLPPYLGPDNTTRAGDTISSLTGVVNYAFGVYEINATTAVNFTRVNDRQATPEDLGGSLTVASFNVLNYFTTIDTGPDICGPAMNQDCRGADSPEEFTRQRDKIISAMIAMDADIIGLMEIENNTSESLQNLVDGLNELAGAGTYDFINTGTIGTDAIKVALIYQPANATPVNAYAILDSSVDPLFNDQKSRPVLAQTFAENATGEIFTVAVNHLKSKGSDCNDVGDPDTGDGQGNCNITRTNAALAEVNWLASDPTNSGDRDFLIIGDLNSYAMEDPIAAIEDGSFTNLIAAYQGIDAYSYVFFGQAGYLDHALASPNLTAQVAGATVWHINADEPSALDYNTYNQPALYNPDPYRASDHDPVVVELNLSRLVTNSDGCYIAIMAGSPYTGAGTIVENIYPLSFFDALRWANAEGLPSNACYEIHGTNVQDKISGGQRADTIFGYGGDDGLFGRNGNDTFTGGAGADFFIGQGGFDTVLDFQTGIDHCSSVEAGCN